MRIFYRVLPEVSFLPVLLFFGLTLFIVESTYLPPSIIFKFNLLEIVIIPSFSFSFSISLSFSLLFGVFEKDPELCKSSSASTSKSSVAEPSVARVKFTSFSNPAISAKNFKSMLIKILFYYSDRLYNVLRQLRYEAKDKIEIKP